MRNNVNYFKQNRAAPRKVWFPGSTALVKGQGLCYDLDYLTTNTGETATDKFGARGSFVALPDNTNNLAFAGVTAQAYKAAPNGQFVEIYEPGSVCDIAIGFATVINSTMLTCSAGVGDPGRFTFQGFKGRGTALALQTKALAAGAAIAFKSVDGSATTAYASSETTISKTGIGTACGYGDSEIDPTEFKVAILGGADDSYGGDSSSGEMAGTGIYAVATAPTADSITIGDNDLGDVDVALYVIKGNPTCLAYLFDGEDSGLQEVISPQDAVAVSSMIGGVTMIAAGYTMAADSTFTLADGLREGQKKGFLCLGTLTTKTYYVTITSGMEADMSSLASVKFDAAQEFITLEWDGGIGGCTAGLWREFTSNGITKA